MIDDDENEFEIHVTTQNPLVEVEEEGQIDIFVNDLSEPADGSRQSASPIQYFEGSPPKKRKKSPSPIQYFEGSPPKKRKKSHSPVLLSYFEEPAEQPEQGEDIEQGEDLEQGEKSPSPFEKSKSISRHRSR